MLVICVIVLVLLRALVVKLVVYTTFFCWSEKLSDPWLKIRSMIQTVRFVIRCTTINVGFAD